MYRKKGIIEKWNSELNCKGLRELGERREAKGEIR